MNINVEDKKKNDISYWNIMQDAAKYVKILKQKLINNMGLQYLKN